MRTITTILQRLLEEQSKTTEYDYSIKPGIEKLNKLKSRKCIYFACAYNMETDPIKLHLNEVSVYNYFSTTRTHIMTAAVQNHNYCTKNMSKNNSVRRSSSPSAF